MGDHAYNIGNDNDRRGDAYMNAWQPTLTTLPWFPIIGNHECIYNHSDDNRTGPAWDPFGGPGRDGDGDRGRHYEVIAWGEAFGQPGGSDDSFPGDETPPYQGQQHANDDRLPPREWRLHSTATSALGHHLAAGSLLGMGPH
jgi:hypothetical protein